MLGQMTTLPASPPRHHRNLHPGQGPWGWGPTQVDGIGGRWGGGESAPSAWPLLVGCWEDVNKWFTNETGWATRDRASLSVIDEQHQGQSQLFPRLLEFVFVFPLWCCFSSSGVEYKKVCRFSVWPNWTWFHKTVKISQIASLKCFFC